MRCVRIGMLGLAAALAACASSPSGPAAPRPAPASPVPSATGATAPDPSHPDVAAAWPTYHGDNSRSGFSQGPTLRPPLRTAWTRQLDGAVYAQPIVVGGHVIAATENNSVYALDAANGDVIWRRHLAEPVPRNQLPCGNIDPLGITGTPAYDADSGALYVVSETT